MQVARADLPITRLRSFTMWYDRDAPDEVARHLNQVEHRPVPPELSMMSPELDYTRKTRRCVGPTRIGHGLINRRMGARSSRRPTPTATCSIRSVRVNQERGTTGQTLRGAGGSRTRFCGFADRRLAVRLRRLECFDPLSESHVLARN